jgi:lipoprotein-anchoring transpeptidase ErfK/SrfK
MARKTKTNRLGIGAALAVAGAIIVTAFSLRVAAMIAPSDAAAAQPAAIHAVAAPMRRPTPTPTPTPATDAGTTAFVVKRILPIDGPIKIGDYAWNDDGVPTGPIVITVDLAAGTMSVFRDGYEIGTAAILYGLDGMPTPLGVFPITQKDAHHVSNLYDAPMPYMMRLTNDGVTIHGSQMKAGWATHGCVGVPIPFAKLVFEQARIGDKVIITNGKMMKLGQHI